MGSAPVGAQCPLTSSLGEFLGYRDWLWYPGLSPVLVLLPYGLRHRRLRSFVANDKDHSVTGRSATAFAFTIFRRSSRLRALVFEPVQRNVSDVLDATFET